MGPSCVMNLPVLQVTNISQTDSATSRNEFHFLPSFLLEAVSGSPGFVLINSPIISKPHLHPSRIYIFVPTLPFILNNSAPFLAFSVLCTEKNHNFSFKLNSYDRLFMSLIILVWFCTSVPLQGEANISWAWMTGLDRQTLDLYPAESKIKIPFHIKYRNY